MQHRRTRHVDSSVQRYFTLKWCDICKDFNKEINVDVVMHTNTKLALFWKLLLCCQDKHFHFMDASWIKWQIMLSFFVLIDKVLFWRLHLGIFLLFSVHQFTTLFFRKTYNWGSSFFKKNLKNHLIFLWWKETTLFNKISLSW